MTTITEYPSAVAKARFVRVSASKARRVIDLVRGKSVAEALDILRWAPQAASEPVAKVIAHRQCGRQRPEQRRSRPRDPRRRVGVRRRGPDRQAHPAARPGACVPNPQAHQPHHGDRRESSSQGARHQGCVVGVVDPRTPCAGQQGRRDVQPRQEGTCQEGSHEGGTGNGFRDF